MKLILFFLFLPVSLLAQHQPGDTSLRMVDGWMYLRAVYMDNIPFEINKSIRHSFSFDYSDISGVDLSRMVLKGNFDYAVCESTDFRWSLIEWADFQGAYLEGADFHGAIGEVHFLNTTGSIKLYGCAFDTIKADGRFPDRLKGKHRQWFEDNYIYCCEKKLPNGWVIHTWKRLGLPVDMEKLYKKNKYFSNG